MRSRAPVWVSFWVKQRIGCGTHSASTQARSFSLTWKAAEKKGETVLPPRPAAAFHVNEKDRGWVDALCVPHPIRCFSQKLTHTGARERIANRTYIRAAGYPNEGFDAARGKAQANGWRIYDVPCGHDVMVDMPDALVKILEEVTPAR